MLINQNEWVGCISFLTYFMPLVSFYTPQKHQKTSGFLMFLEGIERDQWHETGQLLFYYYLTLKEVIIPCEFRYISPFN